MSSLINYMVSFCHKCGNIDKFDLVLQKKDENNYFIIYKCPKCGYNNKIIAGKDDLNNLVE